MTGCAGLVPAMAVRVRIQSVFRTGMQDRNGQREPATQLNQDQHPDKPSGEGRDFGVCDKVVPAFESRLERPKFRVAQTLL